MGFVGWISLRNAAMMALTSGLVLVAAVSRGGEPSEALRRMVEAPRTALNGCEPAIAAVMGGRPSHSCSAIENRHDPAVIDHRHTLQTEGMTIALIHLQESDTCRLESVEISSAQEALAIPIAVGALRAEVQRILGPPPEVDQLVDRYHLESEIGADTVTIGYHDDRVREIEWSYFID